MNFIFMTIIALACWLYHEESCVTSQQTSDSFLSDSKTNVRTSLDYYTLFHHAAIGYSTVEQPSKKTENGTSLSSGAYVKMGYCEC